MKHDRGFMKHISQDFEARKAARKILGVAEQADQDDLKKAYRRAAKKYHPDHCGNSPDANKRFALIKCGYELLAFNKPCSGILEGMNAWSGVPEDEKYCLENPWGHFLWWREKFFTDNPIPEKNERRGRSCI